MRELGGMKGVRLKDITYGNVCERSLRNTETCWTAEGPNQARTRTSGVKTK